MIQNANIMIILRYLLHALRMLLAATSTPSAPMGCLSRGGDTPVDVAALLKGGDVLRQSEAQGQTMTDLSIFDFPTQEQKSLTYIRNLRKWSNMEMFTISISYSRIFTLDSSWLTRLACLFA